MLFRSGSWAIAVICSDVPDQIVVTRCGSPLVVASTEDGAYAASDVIPLSSVTDHVVQLEDGDIALLEKDGGITVYDASGGEVTEPKGLDIDWDTSMATLGGHSDFMGKEIAEQPEAIERLLKDRLGKHGIEMDELRMTREELSQVDRVYIIGCGTSYNVGLIAKTLIEHWARIFVSVEFASEFNYADVLVTYHTQIGRAHV